MTKAPRREPSGGPGVWPVVQLPGVTPKRRRPEADRAPLPLAADTAPIRCSSRGPSAPSPRLRRDHRVTADVCRLSRGLGALMISSGGPESCTHAAASRISPRGGPRRCRSAASKNARRVHRCRASPACLNRASSLAYPRFGGMRRPPASPESTAILAAFL